MKTDEELREMFQQYVEQAYCSRYIIEKPDPRFPYQSPKCSHECPFLIIDEGCGYHEYCMSDENISTIGFIAGFRAAELLKQQP